MATLSDIIRYQKRAKGKGSTTALMTGIKQKTMERLDPRNYLFSDRGTITALFPSLKGYEAKTYDRQKSYPKSISVAGVESRLNTVVGRLNNISRHTKYLPSIARDSNIIRRNIIRMAKALGTKAQHSPDYWFNSIKKKEDAYLAKIAAKQATPQKSSDDTPEKQPKSFIENLISGLIKGFLIGGAVLTGIGLFLKSPEIRAKINEVFNDLGNILVGKEYWEKIKTDIGGQLSGLFTNIITLVTASIGGVVAGLYVAKKALNSAASGLLKIVTGGLGIPGTGTIVPNKTNTPPTVPPQTSDGNQPQKQRSGALESLKKFVKGGVVGGALAGGAYLASKTFNFELGGVSEKALEVVGVTSWIAALSHLQKMIPGMKSPGTAKERTLKSVFDLLIRAKRQNRLLEVLNRIRIRFGTKIAYNLGMLSVGVLPGIGWASLAFNAAKLGLIVYDLILIKELIEEILRERPENVTPISTRDPGYQLDRNEVSYGPTVYGNVGAGITNHIQNDMAGVSGRVGEGTRYHLTDPTRITGQIEDGLAVIRKYESGNNYNALQGQRRFPGTNLPNELDLSKMTLDEVIEYQRTMYQRGYKSSSVGAYQIIHSTMEGLKRNMNLSGDELLTPELQDRMALSLLNEVVNNKRVGFRSAIENQWEIFKGDRGQSRFSEFMAKVGDESNIRNSIKNINQPEVQQFDISGVLPQNQRTSQQNLLENLRNDVSRIIKGSNEETQTVNNIVMNQGGSNTPPSVTMGDASTIDKDLAEIIMKQFIIAE